MLCTVAAQKRPMGRGSDVHVSCISISEWECQPTAILEEGVPHAVLITLPTQTENVSWKRRKQGVEMKGEVKGLQTMQVF